ncbi:PLP-dependent aminotransferase family protein [Desulfocurvibacter africanus]|uniref:aminotransferase-like domain-containing protein n=1 Tax=Desulfocurvibacter africanus TaxID=873 RepID=UPI0004226B6C|nr:PLP-dependent aminotransferase family protein [Desulfocurvibacter africanus]
MRFATRMQTAQRSFIREILKVTADPQIISLAGGLPSPEHFPCAAFVEATRAELGDAGPACLQYSTTEGHPELRAFIAKRYERWGLNFSPDEILITTGSQQGLDLLAKVFLDPGDAVVVERPGYLGAIQTFSLFGVRFTPVELEDDGVDTAALEQVLRAERPKIYYTVPNFQNPSGVTFSQDKRVAVAEIMNGPSGEDTVLIEDNPYGELRFLGQDLPPIRKFMRKPSALLGSFSKIVAPGLRIGWIAADKEVIEQCVTVKQAADLHTSTFAQRVLARFLRDNDLDAHIEKIRKTYGERRQAMVEAIREHFPSQAKATEPEGGMFLWITLPEGCSSLALFDAAIQEKVAFVPGVPFYTDGSGERTLRLNFSNATPERITEGIKRLGRAIGRMLES